MDKNLKDLIKNENKNKYYSFVRTITYTFGFYIKYIDSTFCISFCFVKKISFISWKTLSRIIIRPCFWNYEFSHGASV